MQTAIKESLVDFQFLCEKCKCEKCKAEENIKTIFGEKDPAVYYIP